MNWVRIEFGYIRRAVLRYADGLHPVALVALTVVLLGLGYGVSVVLAPALLAVVTALVALVKVAAVAAAAGLLGRLAVHLFRRHFARPSRVSRGVSA
ncbi:hypothetical protein [Streptomyces chrestomyceticus]|uniref:hypothetical protein n=1 Tax=Streptomyces chrestomyceticus TaxID=68185 RepID=UPI0033EC3485